MIFYDVPVHSLHCHDTKSLSVSLQRDNVLNCTDALLNPNFAANANPVTARLANRQP